MKPQFMVMVLAAVATFATVLTIAMPVFSRDRMGQRMRAMATERDRMRAARLAELAKESQSRLRQTPKGFMQQIVDKLDLRKSFESEEIKNKLKMAGLRGQAPLVAYMFFRVAMPIIVTIIALAYLFVLTNYQYPPIVKFGMAIGAGYLGYYLPNMFIENLVQRRQQSINQSSPTRSTCC
jgi:tight adherence protein C